MEKELIKFNENITKINKDIAKYEDKKGNYFYRVKYGDKVQIIDDEEINPFTNKELEGPIRELIEKIESEDTQ